MKMRQKSKRDQALDAAASVAKTWSEWRLGEKVSKTATKASRKATKSAAKASAKGKKPSRSDTGRRRPLKIAGIVALVGGVGAAVAKKLGGGKAEPLYTPPGPAPDTAAPPPSPVAVEELANETSSAAAGTAVPSTDEPAAAATQTPQQEPPPVVVDDLASDAAAARSAGEASGAPGDAALVSDQPPAEDRSPAEDLTPDPETLISDTAEGAAPGDADEPSDRPL
ncbi:MAG: hypothetical protein ACLGI5_13885 [Thermoleophilia bacterium]